MTLGVPPTIRTHKQNGPLRLLLVEDSPSDALLLREMLDQVADRQYQVTHVETLAAGQGKARRASTDCVLLDLFLPDAERLDGLAGLQGVAPKLPIVVLTGLSDAELALTAVREGAQDFIFKGQINPEALDRSLRYAIERKKIEEELKDALKERDRYLVQLRKIAEVLPMCAKCGSIRPSGQWLDVIDYFCDEAPFLRDGLCPRCFRQAEGESLDARRTARKKRHPSQPGR
jgi:DNA-binding NtrC family response regulator